ncbi:MAG: hypothetical protein NT178_16695 [Proteobacteria bacterium]|nr:hypothetical protein [Pseudomonadota bacterium]
MSSEGISIIAGREEPIDTKTTLGRILNAIDTENDVIRAKSVFDKEGRSLPEKIQQYLGWFFDFHNKFISSKLNYNDLVDANKFIKGSYYIKKYFEKYGTKKIDIYRSEQVIPITVIKIAYMASSGYDRIGILGGLSEQFLKTIIGPKENLNVNGAIALCVIVQMEYRQGAGNFAKAHNKIALNNMVGRIDKCFEEYQTALGDKNGKKGALIEYHNFIESYRKAAEKLKNESDIHRITKPIDIFGLWENYEPQGNIPGIWISIGESKGG